MGVSLIKVEGLFAQAPYAYASSADAPGVVFTAGACPIDATGAVTSPGDVTAQMQRALENLSMALSAAGCGLRDVLKTTVYVAARDRADLMAAWSEVEAAFADHPAPSTLVGVSLLGYAGQLVEIEAVALRPGS